MQQSNGSRSTTATTSQDAAAATTAASPTKFIRQEGKGNTSMRVASAWFRDAAEVPPYTTDYRPYTGKQLQLSRRKNIEDQEKSWDKYYSNNTINGFKDRHYILREFPELAEALKGRMQQQQKSMETVASAEAVDGEVKAVVEEGESREEGGGATTMMEVGDMVHWVEIGCGVGNAMMPVFEEYFPVLRLSGFDISLVAVQLLQKKVRDFLANKNKKTAGTASSSRSKPTINNNNMLSTAAHTEFIALNLSSENMPAHFPAPLVSSTNPTQHPPPSPTRSLADFASVVFVLSAIPPEEQVNFMAQASSVVRCGGWLFVRDYCKEDMAEKRFGAKTGDTNVVSEDTYMRTNGTLSHFFSEVSLKRLLEGAGFNCVHCEIVNRSVENRKEGKSMDRRWIQVRAQKGQ